jgi:Flp pilus assembly protein TadB
VEILAFLLLGFIAMLAIVPPIVRGRIEQSPLESTRHFRKSMLQMAASVNPAEYGKEVTFSRRKLVLPLFFSSPNSLPQPSRQASFSQKRAARRASARRNRVYFVLGLLVLVTGIIAIIVKNVAFAVLFFVCIALLLLYMLLVQFMVKRKERPGF